MTDLPAKQSSLPSLRLTLNGTTLEQVHRDKNVKYPGNDLVLTDGDDVLTGTVEFKGRGNSTWREYAKKPYQIKFSKKDLRAGHACGQEVDPPGQCF